MDRRKSIKALAAGVVAPGILLDTANAHHTTTPSLTGIRGKISVESSWHEWPDMDWVGPEYWGNRLQDWRIEGGKVVSLVRGRNRTLHSLVCQVAPATTSLELSVEMQFLDNTERPADHYAGFRIGARARERYDDYRCAAVFGEGLDAGLRGNGNLFVGDVSGDKSISTTEPILLTLEAAKKEQNYRIVLSAFRRADKKLLGTVSVDDVDATDLLGNLALVHHDRNQEPRSLGVDAEGQSLEGPQVESTGSATVSFAHWKIHGENLHHSKEQVFGPVLFAQYTLNAKVLKLTAQLAPVERIQGHRAELQVMRGGGWKTMRHAEMDPLGRSVAFRIDKWDPRVNVPYRVKLEIPLKNGTKTFYYEGTIAAEPVNKDDLKVAVFSCNCDYGFPDAEVPRHVSLHNPDVAVFLGDQFYEANGGFGIQTSPPEKARLDYLRKWYMFGWSYREIFRHIPCAIIPDDHDVYHGNVWGDGGRHAPSDEGWNYVSQDQGGYKMSAEWVNMVQRTQTSHLPDPHDPTPVKQGINVYYTNWNYAGISFAILEDRKFKSAPKNVLPAEAMVNNGFIVNPDFDIKEHRSVKAELLGDRQMNFLQTWISDWRDGVEMKAVLSQTNLCTVATLPKGSTTDSIVPTLPIYEDGHYVTGDAPTSDMDSNGWPQRGRDEAIKVIRKGFAFHIAGDQHLASMVHYGVDDFGDAGYAFAGPPLNNFFPRRWWPPLENHQPLPGEPAYTGNFFDGFGNRMTVYAAANPRKTGLKPTLLYDRASGYGVVTFNKKRRDIQTECWPRQVNPKQEPNGQYRGWPITVTQEQNYGRQASAWLPGIEVTNLRDAVVEVVDERTGETQYKLRIKGNRFEPKVFAAGTYTVRVTDPDRDIEKEITNVASGAKGRDAIVVTI